MVVCALGFAGGGTTTCGTSQSFTAGLSCVQCTAAHCEACYPSYPEVCTACASGYFIDGGACSDQEACASGGGSCAGADGFLNLESSATTFCGSGACDDSDFLDGGACCPGAPCDAGSAPLNGGPGDCSASLASGATCQPSCDSGHTASGASVCAAGVLAAATCDADPCDASAAPANGGVGTCDASIESGSSCQPACDAGYTVSGVSSCATGVLTAATCSADPCLAVGAPSNGGAGDCGASLASGTSCQPTCNSGFTVSGPTSCWTGTLVAAVCAPNPCDASAAPANGSAAGCGPSLASGATCQPSCDSGYTASGPSSCAAGTLSAATCDANPCDASAAPANGGVGTCGASVISGGSCQPTCDAGYTVSGASSCTAGVLAAALCGADPCRAVGAPSNGNAGDCDASLASGASCQPTCDSGFTVSGPTSCWAGALAAALCAPNPCDASAAPANGGVGDCGDALDSGASCQPICDPGFVASGSSACTAGTLSAASCDAIACSPTQVANSDHSDAGSVAGSTGDTVMVVCALGFAGGGTTTCGTSQSFTAGPSCVQCTAAHCEACYPSYPEVCTACASGYFIDGGACSDQEACASGGGSCAGVDGFLNLGSSATTFCGSGACDDSDFLDGGACCPGAPCDAGSAPLNGGAGDCSASLASGATCQPSCDSGYTASGASVCAAGVLAAATCDADPCDASAAPANGGVGTCDASIESGSSCQPACDAGYTVSGVSSCTTGVLTAATCSADPCLAVGAPSNGGAGDCGASLASGTSCQPTCNSGFTVSRPTSCWTGTLVAAVCAPNPCDASAAPANGSAAGCGPSLASGATCQPSCDSGYTASGPSSCAAGTLSAATCDANPCDASAAPANGGVGTCGASVISGGSCQPTCDAGYTVSGASSCTAGVLAAALCGADPCRAVGAPSNGNAGNCDASLASGASCQPTCDSGFTVSGPTSCWAGALAAALCAPNPCDASAAPANGGVGDCGDALDSGASCQPICDPGFVASGSSACTAGTLSAASCDAIACSPTQVANSDHSDAGSVAGSTGDTVMVVCALGFAGGGTTTCGTSQSFTAGLSCVQCTAAHCEACYPSYPEVCTACASGYFIDGGACSDQEACASGGGSCAGADGFLNLESSATTFCGSGACDDSDFLDGGACCPGAPCDAGSAPLNGGPGDCSASLASGATCQPSCDSGHTASGASVCAAGVLAAATCDADPCDASAAPANGGVGTCDASIESGSSCQPACDAGYTVSGVSSCTTGVLTAATCSADPCLAVGAPSNGGAGDCGASLASGTSCQPTCNSGFTVSGPTSCWTGTLVAAVCAPNPCDASAAPANGSAAGCGPSLASGATCQPSCDSGYTASGPSSCAAGTLSAATCDANPCDASAAPANGGVGTCGASVISGGSCQPTCDAGYTVSGASSCTAGVLAAALCGADPCRAVGAPSNGNAGDCDASLASGASCQPTCDSGFTVSGPTSCWAGALAAALCGPNPCDASAAPANGGVGDCGDALDSGAIMPAHLRPRLCGIRLKRLHRRHAQRGLMRRDCLLADAGGQLGPL